jgi:CubicO group peptidase (beta-lactamase class C family)
LTARARQALDFIFADLSEDAPGASVALLQGERVLAERSIGLTHRGLGARWSLNAKARIASLSKPMAAQVILALVDEGALGLDTRVGAYLPWLRAPQASVSLRQMLSMRAGLLDEFPLVYLASGGAENHHTLDQRLALIAAQSRLNFAPNARTLYSNTGYTLLQRVAETVTGEPFNSLIRKYVCDPADMSGTTFVANNAWALSDLGFGHLKRADDFTPFDYFSETTAASGVVTTLQDLLKWHVRLKQDRTWATMATPGYKNGGYVSGYGLGLELKRLSGLDTAGHAGGLRGWASDYVFIPELDAAVFVLANRIDVNWYERSREALCIAFDLSPDPASTPRLIAMDPPTPAWRASFVDCELGHAIALSGGPSELSFEGRRLPRGADGVFRRSIGVEPICFELGVCEGDAPVSVKVSEGDVVATYRRADPTGADAAAICGIYETSDLPGCIAIAEVGGALRVLVGAEWPQDEAPTLKPLSPSVWRAHGNDETPLDLHFFWPDLVQTPDTLHVTMTRLLRYPYRRVRDATQAAAMFRWTPSTTRKSP